jgi:hypothetical protein
MATMIHTVLYLVMTPFSLVNLLLTFRRNVLTPQYILQQVAVVSVQTMVHIYHRIWLCNAQTRVIACRAEWQAEWHGHNDSATRLVWSDWGKPDSGYAAPKQSKCLCFVMLQFLKGSQAPHVCVSGKSNPLMKMSVKRWWDDTRVKRGELVAWCTHHATRHNTPIHNILSTAPQLIISQKALGMLPENSNVMPSHVGATKHN